MYKVTFTEKASNTQIYYGGCDDPNELLEVGQEYEVEEIDVHSFHTKIKLVGFEGWFNDVTFKYDVKPNKQVLYEENQ